MDLSAIVADAGYVVTLAQLAIKAGEDALPFIQTAYNILVNKVAMTNDQRTALLVQETALRATLNAASLPADAP